MRLKYMCKEEEKCDEIRQFLGTNSILVYEVVHM